jgi:thiol-disulfide isomerase/thioredoxin
MRVITRRAALASVGALAAGTVAAVTVWRKPAPPIATPIVAPQGDAPAVPLQSIATLVPTDPPGPMPELRFLDASGAAHTLGEFAGRGIVLNLWATWCVPCVAELPALAELARHGEAEGIVVVPLSSDRGGAEVVRRFYAAHHLETLPVWLDPKGEAGRALGARGIPTTLVIDREGRERGRLEGAADWASDAARARIKALIG